jgi:putative transposase
VKYAWINQNRDLFSAQRSCQILEVSRTGYQQWLVREPSQRAVKNQALDVQVRALHLASNRADGRPRLVRALHQQGIKVGHEQVRQSMLRQQLCSVHRRRFVHTTDSAHDKPIASNVLNRRFTNWGLNQAWVGDITYVETDEGWLYLATVLDLGSRKIVGWSMSDRMKTELVLQALRSAYGARKPAPGLLMHTDRGSQYADRKHVQLLKDYGMVQSMSRKGSCWDNAVAESFFKTLKVERIYQTRYQTRQQARLDIINWIEGRYNKERLHSANNYVSPNQAELALKAA